MFTSVCPHFACNISWMFPLLVVLLRKKEKGLGIFFWV